MRTSSALIALVLSWAFLGSGSARATGMFGVALAGSPGVTNATVAPGASVDLEVLVEGLAAEPGVDANVDSFTYRIVFPNQQFTLLSNAFAAGFDNTLVPAGFNGSIPFTGLPLLITNSVDAGSPGATPTIPDLYRTTATPGGVPLSGPDVVLEMFGVKSPVSPGSYPIAVHGIELADAKGDLHTTTDSSPFLLEVVPEPGTLALVGLGFASLLLFPRRSSS